MPAIDNATSEEEVKVDVKDQQADAHDSSDDEEQDTEFADMMAQFGGMKLVSKQPVADKTAAAAPPPGDDDEELTFGTDEVEQLHTTKGSLVKNAISGVGRLFGVRKSIAVAKEKVALDDGDFKMAYDSVGSLSREVSVSKSTKEMEEQNRRYMEEQVAKRHLGTMCEAFDLDDLEEAPLGVRALMTTHEAQFLYTLSVKAALASQLLGISKGGKGSSSKEQQALTNTKLEILANAFRVSEVLNDDTEGLYDTPEKREQALRAELLRQLKLLDSKIHYYYKKSSFENEDAYKAWVKKEKARVRALIQAVEDHKFNAMLEEKRLAEIKARQERRKQAGICACFKSEPKIDPAEVAAREEKQRDEHDERVAAEIFKDMSSIEMKEVLNYHHNYSSLLKFLVQHDHDADVNDDKGYDHLLVYPSFYVKQHDPTQFYQYNTVRPLSPDSVQILQSFAEVYGVGPVYAHLQYLELLSYNPNASEGYFGTISDEVDLLEELRNGAADGKSAPWTQQEHEDYERLIIHFFCWIYKCIARYKSIFDNLDDALTEAVSVFHELIIVIQDMGCMDKVVAQLKLKIPDHKEVDATLFMEKAVSDAVTANFMQVVKLTSEQAGIKRFVPRSSFINPMDSSILSEEDDPDSLAAVMSSVTSPDQLIQIFKTVDEEIDQDSRRKHVFGLTQNFNIEERSANSHFALVWGTASTFLRAVAYGLEEKRDSVSSASLNEPERRRSSMSLRGTMVKLTSDEEVSLKERARFENKIFKVYKTMKDFYRRLEEHVKTDEASLQSWFKPFVSRWLETRSRRFKSGYVADLVAQDHKDGWKPLSESAHYSHSVLEIFKFLYPVCKTFTNLPYSREHIKSFAQMIVSVVTTYVDLVAEGLEQDLKLEDMKGIAWGYKKNPNTKKLEVSLADSVITRLNNIYVCKKRLFDLLDDIDLEDAYDNVPQLKAVIRQQTIRDRAKTMGTDEDEELVDDDEVLMKVLDCDEGFIYIRKSLERLTAHIAKGLSTFPRKQFHEMVWFAPIESSLSDEQVQTLLDPTWNYLIEQLDHLTATDEDKNKAAVKAARGKLGLTEDLSIKSFLYDDVFFLCAAALLREAVTAFEHEMVYPAKGKWQKNPNNAQLQRVHVGMQLFQEFLELEYALPHAHVSPLTKTGALLRRVRVVYKTLTDKDSTPLLIKNWEAQNAMEEDDQKVEDMDNEAREAKRVTVPPYIDVVSLWGILKFRAKQGDGAAKEFIKQHSGLLDSLAFWN